MLTTWLGLFGAPVLFVVSMALGAPWWGGAIIALLAAPLWPIIDLVSRVAALGIACISGVCIVAMAVMELAG